MRPRSSSGRKATPAEWPMLSRKFDSGEPSHHSRISAFATRQRDMNEEVCVKCRRCLGVSQCLVLSASLSYFSLCKHPFMVLDPLPPTILRSCWSADYSLCCSMRTWQLAGHLQTHEEEEPTGMRMPQDPALALTRRLASRVRDGPCAGAWQSEQKLQSSQTGCRGTLSSRSST
jgi:hypothetical protein